ncbi:MAG: DinB family protein [Chitinophagaceae bacterium]|nr:MAG: DinB family protein [Chitinophagaceae bacterium]
MSTSTLPEVWLRGALPGITPFLQPVAHALLQAKEEINGMLQNFPDALLWEKPGGSASVGFHLQHIPGVLDRLQTYAKEQALSPEQFAYLKKEGAGAGESTASLCRFLNQAVDNFVERLKTMDASGLTEAREVGRGKLPSTVLGLLFHAAEHTMRHTGQLLVTVNILKKNSSEG